MSAAQSMRRSCWRLFKGEDWLECLQSTAESYAFVVFAEVRSFFFIR
jgi:hypothetical protein